MNMETFNFSSCLKMLKHFTRAVYIHFSCLTSMCVQMKCHSMKMIGIREEAYIQLLHEITAQKAEHQHSINILCIQKAEQYSPCRELTIFVLPQETRELQNKSRWELIIETLSKKFTNPLELKASLISQFFIDKTMYFTSQNEGLCAV